MRRMIVPMAVTIVVAFMLLAVALTPPVRYVYTTGRLSMRYDDYWGYRPYPEPSVLKIDRLTGRTWILTKSGWSLLRSGAKRSVSVSGDSVEVISRKAPVDDFGLWLREQRAKRSGSPR